MDLKQLLEDLKEVQANLDSGYTEEAENLLNYIINDVTIAVRELGDGDDFDW